MNESEAARKRFELENQVITLDPSIDSIFHYDAADQRSILNAAPWKKDPHFFKTVRISSVALIKMVMHARSGGIYEIMGLMQGKIDVENQTIYVMDAFALPVQGTETRVNAANEANEFMVQYIDSSKRVGRLENAIGWYHSHPGYGCWLSGIDVNTQMTNQQYQDPFVAVVIDPNRTISAGKVDIGAFRTYPPNYRPPDAAPSEYQSIPLNKIEDFGVHANSYYPLKVEHFKSSLDDQLLSLLWNKYWVNTLSQSPLIVNRGYAVGQLKDLGEKLNRAASSVSSRSISTQPLQSSATAAAATTSSLNPQAGAAEKGKGTWTGTTGEGSGGPIGPATSDVKPQSKDAMLEKMVNEAKKKEEETQLGKAVRDATKISVEAQHGLITQVLKDLLFNRSGTGVPMPDFGG
ncbi:Mov34-domain-containing protein [Violaceomyces palustris]|uniref:Mov34-domain-containing protein n=1 Tax=Violaceomyces palustris TaxID=1673888 RepID=A0ACD0P3F1_9BASI|nr:Mov34-domain-containing protein [Violaceomyces palustris]